METGVGQVERDTNDASLPVQEDAGSCEPSPNQNEAGQEAQEVMRRSEKVGVSCEKVGVSCEAVGVTDEKAGVSCEAVGVSGEKPLGVSTGQRRKDRQTDRRSAPLPSSLSRSHTLPRSCAGGSRRAISARFEERSAEAGSPAPPKFKVQRSTSVGASGGNSAKQVLLQWCRLKTQGYQNVDIQNLSSSWSSGLAFCALIHSFFPDAFQYSELRPEQREHNFTLAFDTAEEAGCPQLLEVSDMLLMGSRPDPLCVFTYLQSVCQRLRKIELQRKKEREEREREEEKEMYT
ncbi:smoothelin-like protein 2 [Acipenser ruthenus]|uniref:smoothelin-like protein 2 n=1 Tax=Acipenser ruthenus TaxID=7906 RepID=UPI002740C1BA|nr:smoothelin-like protein 2 [Acipenser ruthenus]